MKNLLFHKTSRSWSFEGFGDISDAAVIKNNEYYYPTKTDENGEEILDEEGCPIDDDADDAELINEFGRGLGLTVGQLKNGLGTIDVDGEYDTWKAIMVDDLDDTLCEAVCRYFAKYYRQLADDEVDLLLAVSDYNDAYNDIVADVFEHRSFWRFDASRDTRDSAPDYVVKANDWMIANDYDAIIEEDEE